jgi:hypothetical protein
LVTIAFTDNGTYAYLTTLDGDYPGPYATGVAVVDVATGELVAAPLTFDGENWNSSAYQQPTFFLSQDGTRAFQRTVFRDDGGSVTGATMNVIDTETGQLVSDPIDTYSSSNPWDDYFRMSDDGTRAYWFTQTSDLAGVSTAHLTIIDKETGTVMGEVAVPGQVYGGRTFSPDDQRVYLSIRDYQANTTTVTTIDTTTGTIIGDPIVIQGVVSEALIVSPDGGHAIQITFDDTGNYSVTVIDTGDGPDAIDV